VPSTRDLARQLGVSRRVTVDAYEQLAAEGYLVLRQGARLRVSEAAAATDVTAPEVAPPATPSPLQLPPDHARRFDVPADGVAPLAGRDLHYRLLPGS